MLVQCWYKKLRIAIYRHFKQLFAAGQRLPWQIKSTLIILKILPVRARFAAQCLTLRTALRGYILPYDNEPCRQVRSLQPLTVAAFAVYVQSVKCSYESKLPTSIRRPVRAWLIVYAQIEDMSSSKNVVETGVFYYWCPCVTLGDLGCTLAIPKF